ncbi:MAG: metallophosphoesterase [Polyangiaceae bacterium]|nr:metallophosphoesterase [Polyangiaceae bacterium]
MIASLILTIAPLCVLYVWLTGAFPWLERRKRATFLGLLAFGWLQHIGASIAIHTHWEWAFAVHVALMFAGVTIALATPGLGLLLAGSRAAGLRARRATDWPSREPPALVQRRQVVEATVGTALLGASGAALGWGIARGRHDYRLVEQEVKILGLPSVLDGYVIAQVSDIHAGEFVGDREYDEGLSLVTRARPDLVVVTGDLVDMMPGFAPAVAHRLGNLRARDGIFACLGNHDLYAGEEAVLHALRAAGIEPLVNSGRVIRAGDGGGFALLGVHDLSSARRGGPGPDLRLAAASVPPSLPRVLLSHQPQTVDRWAGQVALQLSGHTHGGQINPGGFLTNLFFEYVAGLYSVGGTTLYVNRGFGTVGPPARVGVPPEVTKIVLVAA